MKLSDDSDERAEHMTGSVNMKKTGEEKITSLVPERIQERKRQNNPEHVEVVMARIFSKHREHRKQRSIPSLELEDVSEDRS
jgi:hypothetical protein